MQITEYVLHPKTMPIQDLPNARHEVDVFIIVLMHKLWLLFLIDFNGIGQVQPKNLLYMWLELRRECEYVFVVLCVVPWPLPTWPWQAIVVARVVMATIALTPHPIQWQCDLMDMFQKKISVGGGNLLIRLGCRVIRTNWTFWRSPAISVSYEW